MWIHRQHLPSQRICPNGWIAKSSDNKKTSNLTLLQPSRREGGMENRPCGFRGPMSGPYIGDRWAGRTHWPTLVLFWMCVSCAESLTGVKLCPWPCNLLDASCNDYPCCSILQPWSIQSGIGENPRCFLWTQGHEGYRWSNEQSVKQVKQ